MFTASDQRQSRSPLRAIALQVRAEPSGGGVYLRMGHRPMATKQAFIDAGDGFCCSHGPVARAGNGYSFSSTALNHAQHIKDEENNEDGAEPAAGAIAPIAAVRPRGDGTDEHQDQDNQQDGEHTPDSELHAIADALPKDGETGYFPPAGRSGRAVLWGKMNLIQRRKGGSGLREKRDPSLCSFA
jgi:hypothetical protein